MVLINADFQLAARSQEAGSGKLEAAMELATYAILFATVVQVALAAAVLLSHGH